MKFQIEKMKFRVFIQLGFKTKFLENLINFAKNYHIYQISIKHSMQIILFFLSWGFLGDYPPYINIRVSQIYIKGSRNLQPPQHNIYEHTVYNTIINKNEMHLIYYNSN